MTKVDNLRFNITSFNCGKTVGIPFKEFGRIVAILKNSKNSSEQSTLTPQNLISNTTKCLQNPH